MTLYKQEFKKHIKKINNNEFIYKHKVAFYLFLKENINYMKQDLKKVLS